MATLSDEFDTVLEFPSHKYPDVIKLSYTFKDFKAKIEACFKIPVKRIAYIRDIKLEEKLSEIFKKPEDLDNAVFIINPKQ
ncbi:17097_t:CDS:2 [Cetraspora pellucida]|uniref:17097_t:CDS:1 n=1 Tax=Cetraspora pellucida TaxID=1433469 RepID=A0A9N8YU32_9GLOM|nr:17097_t:CDS:2 [Cetraspora pellucida]